MLDAERIYGYNMKKRKEVRMLGNQPEKRWLRVSKCHNRAQRCEKYDDCNNDIGIACGVQHETPQPKHSIFVPRAVVLLLGLSSSSHQPSRRKQDASWLASQIRTPLMRFRTAGSVFLSPSRIGTTRWYRRSRLSALTVTAATKSGHTGYMAV